MAAITTRQTAGAGATVAGVPLTNAQLDNNFININTELGQKYDSTTSRTANTFLAAPNGTAGAATFRVIVAADIPTLNQSTTGSAASLSNNTNYLVSRGTVAEASVDTATSNGFYIQNNTSDSDGLLVFSPGGSLGTFQFHAKYTNLLRFRNRTDSTTWTAWKTVLHDLNYNSYSPTLTGGGASGSWAISITGNAATVTDGVYLTNTQTLTNKTLSGPILTSYQETVTTATVSTATYNIDLSLGNIFEFTLTTNVTFTFTNPVASGRIKPITVILKQDATGGRTATFTGARYTDGLLPQLSTGANQIDMLSFFSTNGGSWYFGTFAMANVS